MMADAAALRVGANTALSLAARQRRSPGGSWAKVTRLNEKIATLRQEIQRLTDLNTLMMQTEDKQISLTDPDARSMATSGRGSGMVGYNVQSAVDTKHHLIVTHEVTNVGSDRSQLSRMTEQARAAIGSEAIEAALLRRGTSELDITGHYALKPIIRNAKRLPPSDVRPRGENFSGASLDEI